MKITSRATKNPKMFALKGESETVIHLLQGNVKLAELGMTVEDFHRNQEAINAENNQSGSEPA